MRSALRLAALAAVFVPRESRISSFRRVLTGAITTALLVFTPTVALGYSEDEYAAAVSTTNPHPGQSFTVAVQAPLGTDVTLTVSGNGVSDDSIKIAGAKAHTKAAVGGMAFFTVTLSQEALYQLAASDADGNIIETFVITVGNPAGARDGLSDALGADTYEDLHEVATPGLPDTGAPVAPLLGGVMLLLFGGGSLFFMRRRSQRA